MDKEIGVAFIEESRNRANRGRGRINHCLDQLEGDDMWWAPGKGCNCIGVIIQHLLGNLRQWIISGVGGELDIRDRPREFVVAKRIPKSTLQVQLNEMLDQVVKTYSHLDPQKLLETRHIQGFDRSVLSVIYGTMSHLELHAGQICYVTRLKLGTAYGDYWRPATKEQGA